MDSLSLEERKVDHEGSLKHVGESKSLPLTKLHSNNRKERGEESNEGVIDILDECGDHSSNGMEIESGHRGTELNPHTMIKHLGYQFTPEEEALVSSVVDDEGDGGQDIIYMDRKTWGSCHKVTRKSFRTLQPNKWLNDEILNYFFAIINKREELLCKDDPTRRRSYVFPTYFLKRLIDEINHTTAKT